MARQLRELRGRILTAIGAGFALAAASAACAGESNEREEGTGGTTMAGAGGVAGLSMNDSGGAGTGGSAGASGGLGGTVISVDGRPFVVAGESRLPEVSLGAVAPSDDSLADDERRELAVRWTESARREHASIAAFALLALELLAVGAPAELVEQTNRAALDEIEHARLAFAMASRFAGHEITAGPLRVSGVAPSANLADIAARAAREGCVLETTSLALVLARSELATDPETKRVLERIAEDETRHAELSYRLVAWAIAAGGPEVRAAVSRALEAPVDVSEHDEPDPVASPRYGMLGRRTALRVAAEARRHVVGPGAQALLAAS